MLPRSPLFLLVFLLVAADAKDDALKEELKKLAGTWQVIGGQEKGQEAPEDVVKKLEFRITFAGDKITIKSADPDKAEQGTFKIDPAKKPKEIDFTAKDEEIVGIYSLEGDALKLCLSKNKNRPKEFKTTAGDGFALLILKREK